MVLSVENVNWEELKQRILREDSFVNEFGDECRETCLGRVSDLTPSGKHRDFGRPARNVNGSPGSYKGYVKGSIGLEFQTDSEWWRKLLTEAEKHEIYVRPSDDEHRTFLMAGIKTGDRSETMSARKSKKNY
jgi:hypothetical protein